jgi:RNA polymerase sigma-70 factor (ECF subfamily)
MRVSDRTQLEGVYRTEAEAFAQALRRGDALRDPERWVWKVAFRIASGELRARRTSRPPSEEGSYGMPYEAIAMLDLMRGLPSKQRAVVVLHYYADLPNRRIAEVLGITPATVRVHLSQGRRRLRQLLEEPDA